MEWVHKKAIAEEKQCKPLGKIVYADQDYIDKKYAGVLGCRYPKASCKLNHKICCKLCEKKCGDVCQGDLLHCQSVFDEKELKK